MAAEQRETTAGSPAPFSIDRETAWVSAVEKAVDMISRHEQYRDIGVGLPLAEAIVALAKEIHSIIMVGPLGASRPVGAEPVFAVETAAGPPAAAQPSPSDDRPLPFDAPESDSPSSGGEPPETWDPVALIARRLNDYNRPLDRTQRLQGPILSLWIRDRFNIAPRTAMDWQSRVKLMQPEDVRRLAGQIYRGEVR